MIVDIVIGVIIFALWALFWGLWQHFLQPKKKFLATGLSFAIALILYGVCRYFLIYQTSLFHAPIYKLFQNWVIESYALLIGGFLAILLLVILLGVEWLVNRTANYASAEERASRRAFLKKTAMALPLVTVGGGSVAAFEGQYNIEISHKYVSFDSLPMFLRDYKIAQISDIHIGGCIDLDEFEHIMNLVVAEKPQRLFITGDLIDKVEWVPRLCERLDYWFDQFPDGIDYILGNHEHMRNLALIETSFSHLKMRFLKNDNILVREANPLYSQDRPVYLAGVDYDMEREETHRKEMLNQALTGIPENAFVILLAHHPEFFDQAFDAGIPMTFSGHTHGGQIRVFGMSLVPTGTPYVKGMYSRGNSHGYVNNGTGHWWPVRINCPREITIFTFKS